MVDFGSPQRSRDLRHGTCSGIAYGTTQGPGVFVTDGVAVTVITGIVHYSVANAMTAPLYHKKCKNAAPGRKMPFPDGHYICPRYDME